MNFLLSIPAVKILPTIMIIESICASIIYASKGMEGLKGATYWFAGALITFSVTWIK